MKKFIVLFLLSIFCASHFAVADNVDDLFVAIMNEDTAKIRVLLNEKKVDVNSILSRTMGGDKIGRRYYALTPLDYASRHGKIQSFKVLYEEGAEPSVLTLPAAASSGSLPLVRMIIEEYHALPDHFRDYSAASAAASAGHQAIVTYLISLGVSPQATFLGRTVEDELPGFFEKNWGNKINPSVLNVLLILENRKKIFTSLDSSSQKAVACTNRAFAQTARDSRLDEFKQVLRDPNADDFVRELVADRVRDYIPAHNSAFYLFIVSLLRDQNEYIRSTGYGLLLHFKKFFQPNDSKLIAELRTLANHEDNYIRAEVAKILGKIEAGNSL